MSESGEMPAGASIYTLKLTPKQKGVLVLRGMSGRAARAIIEQLKEWAGGDEPLFFVHLSQPDEDIKLIKIDDSQWTKAGDATPEVNKLVLVRTDTHQGIGLGMFKGYGPQQYNVWEIQPFREGWYVTGSDGLEWLEVDEAAGKK